jgi:hypothetical protein
MKSVIFLGPTLLPERACEYLADCEIWSPAAQGDVLRALNAGAMRLGIIDGYFDIVPSVGHKEILYAMETGAVVFGSASMGALRAAELHTFGMIGVGRIFELYRDGTLEDDDEVAVTHAPASCSYRTISEAMVNIRARVDEAVQAAVIKPEFGSQLVMLAKAMSFRSRSFKRLVATARESGLESCDLDRFESFATASHVSLKERDAVAMLRRMARGEDRPTQQRLRVERTVYLERLRLQIAREATRPLDETNHSALDGLLDESEYALLGLLAEGHIDLLSTPATEGEIESAARDFRKANGLITAEAMQEWLDGRGLTLQQFKSGIRSLFAIRKLRRMYGPEIDHRLHAIPRLRDRPVGGIRNASEPGTVAMGLH